MANELNVANTDTHRFVEQASNGGTPASGFGKIWSKDDGTFQYTNDAGTDFDLTGTNISAENVSIATGVGSPTIDQLQEYIDSTGSAGFYSGGAVTDGGGGLLDVAAGAGFIRASASSTAPLLSFAWSTSSGIAVTDNTTQYIFVDDTGAINLNTSEFIESEDNILIGLATKESGSIVSVYNLGVRLDEGIGQAGRFIRRTHSVTRDIRRGGLFITETGTRNLILSTGHLWWGRTDYTISALNTSVSDTFTTYSITGQEAAAATQWDNLQYDNAGTLTTITNNRWVNHYFYLEPDGDLTMIYGRAEYTTQTLAEVETPPISSLPNKLSSASILTARLTFLKSAATATISSAFDTVFSGSGASATEFADDVFRINDNSDNTKQIAFEASGVPTSTTATLSVTTSVTLLKDNLAGTVPPTTTDDSASGYSVGSHWIDVVANLGYICVDATASAAVWVEVTAGASGGEANTASNIGVGGVGFFDAKVASDLQFKNAIAGSSKTTVTDVPANNEVAFDVVEAQLTLDNLGGTLAVTKGGTGSTTASGARTNLGVVINTDVQAWDAQLDDIAALALTDGNFIVGNGANWVAEGGATARTSLGLVIGTDVQAWAAALDAVTGTNTGDEPDASTSVKGITEWATTAEVEAGTSSGLVVRPVSLPSLHQDSIYNYVLTTGSANAYLASFSPTPNTYTTGQIFHINASFAVTGAATIAINGQAAKSIVKEFNAALVADDIKSGSLVTIMYDGTNFQMLTPIANAASGGGATVTNDESTLNLGSDLSTSSTSFVDADATNLSLTITTTGGDVRVGFYCSLTPSGGGVRQMFDIDVDGARVAGDDGMIVQEVDSARPHHISFVAMVTGLSAASHTFKVQWRVNSGSTTMHAGSGGTNQDIHPQFWVEEIS